GDFEARRIPGHGITENPEWNDLRKKGRTGRREKRSGCASGEQAPVDPVNGAAAQRVQGQSQRGQSVEYQREHENAFAVERVGDVSGHQGPENLWKKLS